MGTQLPPWKGARHPLLPTFLPTLLRHGRPSQLLLSTCHFTRWYSNSIDVRWKSLHKVLNNFLGNLPLREFLSLLKLCPKVKCLVFLERSTVQCICRPCISDFHLMFEKTCNNSKNVKSRFFLDFEKLKNRNKNVRIISQAT